MSDDPIDGRIGFETDGRTLCIRDALEGEEFPLRFDREPRPQPALPDLFHVPVDRAVSFETESVSVPVYSSVVLRDAEGEFVARLDKSMDFPRGTYFLDLSGVTKAFVRIPDVAISATGMVDSEAVEVTFDRPTTVTVGARSLHTRPEATITVPDDPTALAEAVSVLGSSIKEFTPERSWPTLRGYPPRIRNGDELDIPSPLVPPDTGVEVVVRPTYADVYRLSTLAYYLGARVVVGDAPAIRLDTGYVESLPTHGIQLEERVEELLRTWFFLDTLARTEGYVKSDRHEYEQVGPELPFYPPNLADRSMSERLMEYLEVDPETVSPYAPAWPTEAVLRPVPEAAELLPHLAHMLAPIRVRGSEDPTADAPVALATSPWLPIEDAVDPENDVPDPDADPLSAGSAVLTPESYENYFRRTRTARGEFQVVILTDSTDRAAAIRRVLSEPATPDGIRTWRVLDRPDAEQTAAALSDPDIDIAYCGLPTEGDRIVAGSETVELDGLGGAPALTVFEGTESTRPGVSVVENGGLSAVVAESALEPSRMRRLFGLLAVGIPVAASVGLSDGPNGISTRLVGDPSVEVASKKVNGNHLVSVDPGEGEDLSATIVTILSMSMQIGSETHPVVEYFSNRLSLVGARQVEQTTLSPSEVSELLNEDDVILRLNGTIVLENDNPTEEDITKIAKRNPPNEVQTAELTNWCNPE